MRVKNSILNIAAGLGNQIIITLLSFISRTIFINSLGIAYLGINGLLTNILSMLTLAEAGVGASIVYSLYKPVAENDQVKISVLMNFYKKAYMVVALVIFLLGLSIMPFLQYFVKGSNFENLYLIYGIFLINTILPYLYVHKNNFLGVCQKGYIVTGIYSVSAILATCLKICVLYFTQNYILYLIIDSILIIITAIFLSIIVNKTYPFLKNTVSSKLDSATKQNIIKNVKAIVLQNIGTYLVMGTDNIIISSFISVAAVGLYSNYNMLIEICRTFINQIFNNIYHSVGNLVANESVEKIYSIYKVYMLLNFWLYSFFTISLCILIEPFVTLWLGSEYLMDKGVLVILMLVFYERGMRNAITTVKTTAGIFHEDRYAPLIQAVINLVTSVVLVDYIGIVGVFIGTLVSALAVPFWVTPYLVYKNIFCRPVTHYFFKYVYYTGIGITIFLLTSFICSLVVLDNIYTLMLKAIICVVVPHFMYVCIFYKTDEFKYLLKVFANVVGLLVRRFKVNRINRYYHRNNNQ